MRVRTYMYVYLYKCMYCKGRVHTCMYAYTRCNVCACVCVHILNQTHLAQSWQERRHTYIHAYTHTYCIHTTYIQTYIHGVCVCVCVCVCVYEIHQTHLLQSWQERWPQHLAAFPRTRRFLVRTPERERAHARARVNERACEKDSM